MVATMSKSKQRFWQGMRDLSGTWGVGCLVVIAAFVTAYQFVEPAPPDRIVMATGAEGGAYRRYGEAFAAYLESEGVMVELRETAGSVENLALLEQADGVDIGFVQGGLSGLAPTDNVVALGSLYLEPIWMFLGAGVEIDDIDGLTGMRLAVGAEGSGTRAVVSYVLTANGIDAGNAALLDVPVGDIPAALADGRVDVAFLIAGASSDIVQTIAATPGIRLHDIHRADAFVRRYPFLSKVSLPMGVLNLRENLPAEDVETVALTAMLAANRSIHPALVDLLLVAAENIHGRHTLLSDVGDFPSRHFIDLPLNDEADRHFRRGPPFLMRYMPFWAATLIDRLWVMLLPLIGLAIPLIKLIPPAYRWRIRRRLLRIYSALEDIDPARNAVNDEQDRSERLSRLRELEHDPSIESLPREYTDDVYKLRRDMDLVRRRLAKVSQL